MQNVTITKKFEFSASHRYWCDDWSSEKNKEFFGKGVSPYGHGHNYDLHITVGGRINPDTGMIINLSELKKIVNNILQDFDHKFLNVDTPYFKDKQPSTENIALTLFELIEKDLSAVQADLTLERIRLYERSDVYTDVWKEAE